MFLNNYINENFLNLELRPPLFYNWNIGVRFELGTNFQKACAYENSPYLQGVYKRAVTIFESLHANGDDILIVVDVNNYGNSNPLKHRLNIFSRYVKEKSILQRLNQETFPWNSGDDEESEFKTHRFTLKCKPYDFKYVPMLKAICNRDMGLKPIIVNRVYFININRKTIFHIYDDRGCDLIATSSETIRDVYEKHNNWILDYDRNEIDMIFK